jgi:hypothetical protein
MGIAAMRMLPVASLVVYGIVAALFLAVAVWLKAIDMSL